MPGRATRASIPVVVLHPAASFRHGLGEALSADSLLLVEPADLTGWLAEETDRVVVVADGTEAEILAGAGPATTVVVLVAALEVDAYRRTLAAGAHGVAHIDAAPDLIVHVVRAALAGEVVMPAEIARRMAGRPVPPELRLTTEERSFLQRLSEGATVVQLAGEFYLAERSVRRRLQNLYIRMGVDGRAAALKRAGQLGLID